MPKPFEAELFELTHALDGEVEHLELTRDREGLWLISGLLRGGDGSEEYRVFLEELSSEALGGPCAVEGPWVGPGLTRTELVYVRLAAQEPSDVHRIERGDVDGTLQVWARQQPTTLSVKRNRLKKLQKSLPGWSFRLRPLGGCRDPRDLTSTEQVRGLLAACDPEGNFTSLISLVHGHRVDTKRLRVEAFVDASADTALERHRLARMVCQATDIDFRFRRAVTPARAVATVQSALSALGWVDGVSTRWDSRIRGVAGTVEAPATRRGDLDAVQTRLAKELDVPVVVVFDSGRALMVSRILQDFPPSGILTGLRHVDGPLYSAEALLPLRTPEELEAWTDEMQERWEVEIMLDEPRLYAPDMRHREHLDPGVEAISLRYNRPKGFSPEAQAAAQGAVDRFSIEEAAGQRLDFRSSTVLSIDPARTRDLDDALSIQERPGGGFRVGVHIADVCPFLPRGSVLDEEALLRGFTTYLKEGEIPVLPEVLCNQVCSLHGNQDSLAFSLFMDLDSSANLEAYDLKRTVIHNHCRLNYKQAQAMLDGEDHEHGPAIRQLGVLAKLLRADRVASGALDLSLEATPEQESHQLIEEFMLLANDCVSRFLAEHHPSGLCLYRTHPQVRTADYGALTQVAKFLGAEDRVTNQASMQEALVGFVGTSAFEVFRFHVGRSLEKATYHVDALGHGALAKDYYAHFTSPIRRYSDVIVHRLLEDAMAARDGRPQEAYQREELLPICDHLNRMEIRVDSASYESHKLAELQRFDRGGMIAEGRVLGLMGGRAWIRLVDSDLRVTVRVRDDAKRDELMPVRLVDEISGMSLAIGQEIRVRLSGVDWNRKQVEARLIG